MNLPGHAPRIPALLAPNPERSGDDLLGAFTRMAVPSAFERQVVTVALRAFFFVIHRRSCLVLLTSLPNFASLVKPQATRSLILCPGAACHHDRGLPHLKESGAMAPEKYCETGTLIAFYLGLIGVFLDKYDPPCYIRRTVREHVMESHAIETKRRVILSALAKGKIDAKSADEMLAAMEDVEKPGLQRPERATRLDVVTRLD
jgi:hypothetical protein